MALNQFGAEYDPSQHRISPNQFGQGGLFAQPKPSDEHRYPRGYTPQRMQEVMAATSPAWSRTPTGVSVSSVPHPDDYINFRGVHPFIARGVRSGLPQPDEYSEVTDDAMVPMHERYVARQVNEVLARSTMPAESMGSATIRQRFRGVVDGRVREKQEWQAANERGITDDIHAPDVELTPLADSNAGEYHANKTAVDAGRHEYMPTIKLDARWPSSDEKAEQTLLHEWGHHRSSLEQNRHSSVVSGQLHESHYTPAQAGKEEGFADRNMLDHWRPDPRSGNTGRMDPTSVSYSGRNYFGNAVAKLGTFNRGYEKTNPEPAAARRAAGWTQITERQFISPDPYHGRQGGWRETPVNEWSPPRRPPPRQNDPHLFGRDAEVTATNAENDYGQWGYENFLHEGPGIGPSLGTIKVGRGVPPEELRQRGVTAKQARQRRPE